MDGGQLHRLGRVLIELSRLVTGEPGDPSLTPGEIGVLEDTLKHPGTSVGEIHRRTGFVQSHVSASVSRLRAGGLVETSPDPTDGRRTLVRVGEQAMSAILRRADRGVDDTIRQAVGDPRRAERLITLLDELAELLL